MVMGMQALQITGTTVTQAIIIDDSPANDYQQFIISLGLSGNWMLSEVGRVGDTYNPSTGEFTTPEPPPEPAPEPTPVTQVTRRQARLALLEVDKLDMVENAIDQAGTAARIEYEADVWERANPFLNQLWEELGGTQEELDGLFMLAATK